MGHVGHAVKIHGVGGIGLYIWRCSCGSESYHHETPDDLEELWLRHRGGLEGHWSGGAHKFVPVITCGECGGYEEDH